MDWRDLIAWQQVRVTEHDFGGGQTTPQLIVRQDPSRIYLSISQNDGDNPHAVYPGACPVGQVCGIPIGGATAWSGPGADSLNMNGAFVGTYDSGTGDFSFAGTLDQTKLSLAAVPATLEYWLDRHGALCQFPWWFLADGCTVCIIVVEVLMDRSPCDWTASGQIKPARPRGLPRGRSLFSSLLRRNGASAVGRGGAVVGGDQWRQSSAAEADIWRPKSEPGLD